MGANESKWGMKFHPKFSPSPVAHTHAHVHTTASTTAVSIVWISAQVRHGHHRFGWHQQSESSQKFSRLFFFQKSKQCWFLKFHIFYPEVKANFHFQQLNLRLDSIKSHCDALGCGAELGPSMDVHEHAQKITESSNGSLEGSGR